MYVKSKRSYDCHRKCQMHVLHNDTFALPIFAKTFINQFQQTLSPPNIPTIPHFAQNKLS